MKTKLSVFLISILSFYSSIAQVPADSLTGTYVGQFWFANPNTSPWVISIDTLFVVGVDTINCRDTTYSTNGYFNGIPIFYTTYNYCNTAVPSNGYSLFYSADSLRMVYDNIPQPYPNSPMSERFYGKRISGSLPLGINKEESDINIDFYPNPVTLNTKLILSKNVMNASLFIYNILGIMVKVNKGLSGTEININREGMQSGMYFFELMDRNKLIGKGKLIVE